MGNRQTYVMPTPRYALIQGSFWGSFCIIFAYASVYLLSKGYSNSQIGVVIAVAGGVSACLQPAVANYADCQKRGTLRWMISIGAMIIIGVSAVLLIPGMHFIVIGIFYGVVVAGLQVLTPLIYAIGMECINYGIPVNFGLARGIGSMAYAAVSYVAGVLVTRFSSNVIPMMIIFFYLLLIIASLTFKFPENSQADKVLHKDEESLIDDVNEDIIAGRDNSLEINQKFFSRYRKFFVLLVGVTFSFISHNLLNNYMFQVMEYHGGGSSEMGTALAIAATIELPTMLGFSLLIKRVRSNTLIKVSGTFFMIKALLTLLAPNVFGIYIAQITQLLGFALQVPASVYYVNALMKPRDRVKGQAFMTATNTLGSIGGSLIGGVVLDTLGVSVLLLIGFVVAAAGMLVTFISTEKVE